MKLLGALFLVSLVASNLRTCEAAGKKAVRVGAHSKGKHHAYGIRRHLDQSQTQTEDMDHFNVTLENNELLHQLLSLMNSSSSICTTASEPKSYPMDCSVIFAEGQTQSGIYEILPIRDQLDQPLSVFCDMEDGGGWTVILLRNNASEHVNFTRNWNDYKEFFGSADEEYWIGNENLHALTSSNQNFGFKFEAKDGDDHTWEGYESFSVASEENGYRLTLEGNDDRSTMDKTFGFKLNNGQNFSTFDHDNDVSSVFNCAKSYDGGWWYNYCTAIYATGIHGTKFGLRVSAWSKEDKNHRNANWLQIKIRPTKQEK